MSASENIRRKKCRVGEKRTRGIYARKHASNINLIFFVYGYGYLKNVSVHVRTSQVRLQAARAFKKKKQNNYM